MPARSTRLDRPSRQDAGLRAGATRTGAQASAAASRPRPRRGRGSTRKARRGGGAPRRRPCRAPPPGDADPAGSSSTSTSPSTSASRTPIATLTATAEERDRARSATCGSTGSPSPSCGRGGRRSRAGSAWHIVKALRQVLAYAVACRPARHEPGEGRSRTRSRNGRRCCRSRVVAEVEAVADELLPPLPGDPARRLPDRATSLRTVRRSNDATSTATRSSSMSAASSIGGNVRPYGKTRGSLRGSSRSLRGRWTRSKPIPRGSDTPLLFTTRTGAPRRPAPLAARRTGPPRSGRPASSTEARTRCGTRSRRGRSPPASPRSRSRRRWAPRSSRCRRPTRTCCRTRRPGRVALDAFLADHTEAFGDFAADRLK